MNITEATKLAMANNGFIMKANRSWCLHVAAGSVYRNQDGDEISLDARDCLGTDWYVVNDKGEDIQQKCGPSCVMCGEKAITTAAQIPVCEHHWHEYRKEAETYSTDRPFYSALKKFAGKS